MLLSVLLPYFTERRFKMFLKFVLLGISLTLIMFFFDVLLPKIKLKIRLHKELKDSKKKREVFNNKMKELEIK